ncbi:MAG: hypothetical protein IT235_02580 [Bacteroidia bacterium]|nr:hypothetical protein [Bacteroidia bacterium]
MKLFSTILSAYVLILTATSTLTTAGAGGFATHQEKSCCRSEKEQNNTEKQNKGCCAKGICNPFMSCCNYSLLTTDRSTIPPLPPTTQTFKQVTENPVAVFMANAWHPPKVV